MTDRSKPAANKGFASGGVTFKLGALSFYSSSVQVESFVLGNPPERKARKRYAQLSMKVKNLFILSLLGLFGCKGKSKEVIFWEWFTSIEKEFYSDYIRSVNIDQRNQELLSELHKVNSAIFFEISYGDDNKLNLTFTAEGMIEIFPTVEKLVEVAPDFESWNIVAFRQRIPGDDFTVEYGKYVISYSDIYFQYSTQNKEFGIQLNILNYDSTGEMQDATYLLLDNLLGEEDVVKKIDWIEWAPLDLEMKDSLLPFTELRELVDTRN